MSESNSKLKHHEMKQLLPWYANASLDPDERKQLEEHLRDCDSCRREIEWFRKVGTTVSETAEEIEGLPEESWQERLKRLKRGRENRGHSADAIVRASSPGFSWLTRAAAFCTPLLLVAVIFQSFFYIPGLQRELAALQAPALYEPSFLTSGRGGSIELGGQAFLDLEIDNNFDATPETTLSCELRFQDGSIRHQLTVPALNTLHLRFPAAGLPEGSYTLAVSSSSQQEPELYSFVLRRK